MPTETLALADAVVFGGAAFFRQDILSIFQDKADVFVLFRTGERLRVGEGQRVFDDLVLWWNGGVAPSAYNPQTGRFE